MTGKTHETGGMFASLLGFAILKENGYLLEDSNLLVQWMVMYPFTMWGSVASDLDHHWKSCPRKDYPSRLVNMALHITKPIEEHTNKGSVVNKVAGVLNASHRSWQTHSDFTLIFLFGLLYLLTHGIFGCFGAVDSRILLLVLMGITMGVAEHFILDMLTPEGITLVGLVILETLLKKVNPGIKLPTKLKFVPKSHFFATGQEWEKFVQKVLKIATYLMLVWFLISFLTSSGVFDITHITSLVNE